MSDLRLPEHSLPGFEALVNGTLWQRWADEGRVPPVDSARDAVRYLRLKPDHSCRLVIDASTSPSDVAEAAEDSMPPRRFLLLFHSDEARAREVYEKIANRPAFLVDGGPEPFLDSESAAIALPYPNDPDLPALRHVHEPARFRRTLGELLPGFALDRERIKRRSIESTLLAYKPGRRSVYRTRFEVRSRDGESRSHHDWHVQIERPESAARSVRKVDAISRAAAACDNLRVNTPLGWERGRGLIATPWVGGASLADHMSVDDLGAEELVSVFQTVGAQLAELHALDVDLDHVASPIEEIESIGSLARDLAYLLPEHSNWIRELADRLCAVIRTLTVEPSAIVHGDLHPAQLIVASELTDIRQVSIVDFDRAGRGYARLDLANLLAHLEAPHSARAILESYAQRSGTSHEPGELVAVCRFRRCFEPFRSLRRDWPEATVECLRTVESDLEASDGS